jgi:outer membrane protein assembly factor BamB
MRRILPAVVALALLGSGCFGADAAPTTTTTSMPDLADLAATATSSTTTTTATTTTTTIPPRPPGSVPSWTVGEPWGEVSGLTMFRGNPTRTWYGAGPAPRAPERLWRFPDAPMCGNSPVGGQDKVWCGSGWTGQPVVWERPDGITEVIFGAYDKHIHFVDAATGERTRPDFPMGDIIKGSVTLDPDGYPLLYSGSRDPRFRIIALDRETPTELWSLDAASVDGMWNNDWDGNPVIVDDLLFEGGENSWFFVVKLNRAVGADGLVTVDPEVVFRMPAFTDALLSAVGRQQSIESSPAVFEQRVYFTNSAGRVVGLDVSGVESGSAPVVFDFWAGDDIDATPVIDSAGMLYVSVEVDLATARAAEVGQLLKLDPYSPDDPIVWSIDVPGRGSHAGGIWATPALAGDMLFAATNPGDLLAVDTTTGEVVWSDDIGGGAWSSPVIVDDTLIVAVDCDSGGGFRAYDVIDPRRPIVLWELPTESACIESTPAVWKGAMYVGSRDGYFYAFGDR